MVDTDLTIYCFVAFAQSSGLPGQYKSELCLLLTNDHDETASVKIESES